jgi:hypothetical protein
VRRLLWIAVWLYASLAGVSRAADFQGVGGAVLHFSPPRGNCLLPSSSPAYAQLRSRFISSSSQVRLVFLPCNEVAQPPNLPTSIGFVYLIHYEPGDAPSDDSRSDWLPGVAPRPAAGRVLGVEGHGNAFLYDWTVDKDVVDGKDYAEVSAQGATVVRNTPVDIELIREVNGADVVGVATAMDQARAEMHAAFDAFAKANGLSLERAATHQQVRDAYGLGGMEFVFIGGGIVLITIVVRRFWAQAALSAFLAVAGVLVYESAPGAGYATSTSWGDLLLWGALAVVLVGIANGLLKLGEVMRIGRRSLTDRIRNALSTRAWLGSPAHEGDFTKRWFVTVAAATGAVVFAMLVRPHFAGELMAAVGPTRFVFTLLIAAVSVTLIGPVETYIFESRIAARGPPGGTSDDTHAEEESRFEHMLELMSPRALGRFVLVLVFMMMLTIAHGALEASVHEGDSMDSLTMLIAGVGPAIVTYYWCSALQRCVPSVARRAGVAAAIAGALLIGAPVALMAVPLFMTHLASASGQGSLLGDVIAAPVAILMGAIAFGGLALGGGLTIDQARVRRLGANLTVLLLGSAMMVVAVACVALFNATGSLLFRSRVTASDWMTEGVVLLAICGWTFGLMVSGFPSVLRASLERAPPASRPGPLWRVRIPFGWLRARRPSAPSPVETPIPAAAKPD